MVSTRGVRFVYSEGERVLCYEPDPNKAKVLYDSKVLECRVAKDVLSGKKSSEYLVHFYGWNSSWDRCVAEENILRDSPDNRQLQRQLAEEAAHHLKMSNKKLKLNKIPAIIKEAVLGNSSQGGEDDEQTQESLKFITEGFDDTSLMAVDDEETNDLINTTSESLSENNSISDHVSDNGLEDKLLTPIEPLVEWVPIPEELKIILEKDYLDVVLTKTSYELPFKTTVQDILSEFKAAVDDENFAEWIPNYTPRVGVTRAACNNPQPFPEMPLLVDEFVSSTRIYFDTIFAGHLCYSKAEREALETLGDNKLPSEVFGFIHFLRYIVILPDFIAATTSISKQQGKILVSMYECCVHFLLRNSSRLL